MTTIAILPESAAPNGAFRAIAGEASSSGRTPGEALDALTAKLPETDRGTLVVVQCLQPDQYFTAEQQSRLAHLWQCWRMACDAGAPWSSEEQSELEALVEAETRAAGERAADLVRRLSP
jgi:hypothetical protein